MRETPRDTLIRTYSSGGSRGCVLEADDERLMQELKIKMMKDEERVEVEHPQNYGFTSYVKKAEMKDEETIDENKGCAEHWASFTGGSRTFPVVQILDDRRYRLRNLKEGEVCVYDDQQQKVHIQRDQVYGRSQFQIRWQSIKDEPDKDGHGRNEPNFESGEQKPSRDQTKAQQKPLSTWTLNNKSITSLRTDEDGKPLTEIFQSEKKITSTVFRDGRPFLVIDQDRDTALITLQTLRGDRPHLQFSLDDDNGKFSFDTGGEAEGTPHLVFEQDDAAKRITIRTDSNTSTIWDNNSMTIVMEAKGPITIHSDAVVKVGDHGASEPAGKLGSIDTEGHRLIGDLAKKVLVK
jgi:hypothetical protein